MILSKRGRMERTDSSGLDGLLRRSRLDMVAVGVCPEERLLGSVQAWRREDMVVVGLRNGMCLQRGERMCLL